MRMNCQCFWSFSKVEKGGAYYDVLTDSDEGISDLGRVSCASSSSLQRLSIASTSVLMKELALEVAE